MTLGLIPFPFAAAPFAPGSAGAFLGWLVFTIGFITHASGALQSKTAKYLRMVDVGFNVAAVLYVNALTHWQPCTALVSLMAAVVWALVRRSETLPMAVVHVLFVQWPLCFLLYAYEYGWWRTSA